MVLNKPGVGSLVIRCPVTGVSGDEIAMEIVDFINREYRDGPNKKVYDYVFTPSAPRSFLGEHYSSAGGFVRGAATIMFFVTCESVAIADEILEGLKTHLDYIASQPGIQWPKDSLSATLHQTEYRKFEISAITEAA
jgi:hypothetical protein